MKANEFVTEAVRQRLDPKCWKGKHKEGTKIKGGVRVNNCVPNESIEEGISDQIKNKLMSMVQLPVIKKLMTAIEPYKNQVLQINNQAKKMKSQGVSSNEIKQFLQNNIKSIGSQVTNNTVLNESEEFTKEEIAQLYKLISRQQWLTYLPLLATFIYDQLNLPNIWGDRGVYWWAYAWWIIIAIFNEINIREKKKKLDAIGAKDPDQDLLGRLDKIKEHSSSKELEEEFDLIESTINYLAERNDVDAEVIWEDLESLTDDELYVFAVTQEPIMESITESRGGNYEQMGYRKSNKDKFALLDRTLDAVILTTNNLAQAKQEAIEWAEYDDIRTEVIQQDIGRRVFTVDGYAGAEKYLGETEAWQKANNRDKTDGMSRKAVKSYRREHPGSKLQTAVTTKPSKLKKGSKASKRRKSYCSRSRGQMKMHNISCAKTPDKAICKARRRWNC